MSEFSSEIHIEGSVVRLAKVVGSPDVFSRSKFIFERPIWIDDEDVESCAGCGNKFTQIRRRHHCRQCGKIFCNKCCSEKLHLHHLGMEQHERICESCKPISEALMKAQAPSLNSKQEAAANLSQMVTNTVNLIKLIELGGVQSIIYLCNARQYNITANVSAALHVLTQHQPLFPLLAASGSVKALASVLSQSEEFDDENTRNAIGALHLLAKSEAILPTMLDENVMPEILRLLEKVSPSSLIAVQSIQLLMSNSATRYTAINRFPNLISKIVSLVNCQDEQMKMYCLDMLATISEDREEYRDLIIKEDFKMYKPILKIIRSSESQQHILDIALFLLANLASTKHHQELISDHLDATCDMLQSQGFLSENAMTNIIRGLANCTKVPCNSHIVLSNLEAIVRTYLSSEVTTQRLYCLRLIFRIMYDDRISVISMLSRINETKNVLEQMSNVPGVLESIHNLVEKSAPDVLYNHKNQQ